MKIDSFVDPYAQRPWSELGVRVLSSGAQVAVTLGYPAAGYSDELRAQLQAHLGVDALDLEVRFNAPERAWFRSGEALDCGRFR